MVALALTTALATTALGGCTTKAAPQADLSAGKAQTALARGDADTALSHAEAAVLADPRNAAYRAMLGATYMEAGRFQSAATSFGDAMTLGDESPRTALSLALALVAAGDSRSAHALLTDWRDDLDPADLGLALALTGDANQGVHVLTNALRNGQNSAKVRQNLAYAYALKGDWRAARVMAAEDVPADKVGDRIGEWARYAAPEMSHQRVAALLEVPLVGDVGQPAALALANHPSNQQMAAEAATLVPAQNDAQEYVFAMPEKGELPALDAAAMETPALARAETRVAPVAIPVSQPAPVVMAEAVSMPAAPAASDSFDAAFAVAASTTATLAQVARNAVNFFSSPVIQTVPARSAARTAAATQTRSKTPATAPQTVRAAAKKGGNHAVQLGSFTSKDAAQKAWGIYTKRHASLDQYDMVITEARVNGKTYWRVAAGNMASTDARSMCSTVKARGFGCIAYAASSPLPGTVDAGIRMASR